MDEGLGSEGRSLFCTLCHVVKIPKINSVHRHLIAFEPVAASAKVVVECPARLVLH